MGWSIRVGSFRGIGVYVHFTFLLLLAFYGIWSVVQRGSVAAGVEAVLFLAALFLCVVLHEFGHSLTAQRFGIPTRDITLLPIGGVARLERMPEKPHQELLVALAGPVVNVVIAAALYFAATVTGLWTPFSQLGPTGGSFLQNLAVVNVALVVFNMLPAFPLDGGRVFRALLATRYDYARATKIAAVAGKGMAILFGVAGLFSNPMLLLIAVFVWTGAGQEARAARMRAGLYGIPASRFAVTEFTALPPTLEIHRAAQVFLAGMHRELPVVSDGDLLGFVSRPALLNALSTLDPATAVDQIMVPGCEPVDADEPLTSALEKMQRSGAVTAPIMRHGNLTGLLHLESALDLAGLHSGPTSPSFARRSAAASPH